LSSLHRSRASLQPNVWASAAPRLRVLNGMSGSTPENRQRASRRPDGVKQEQERNRASPRAELPEWKRRPRACRLDSPQVTGRASGVGCTPWFGGTRAAPLPTMSRVRGAARLTDNGTVPPAARPVPALPAARAGSRRAFPSGRDVRSRSFTR
jgi:hypothetical protein